MQEVMPLECGVQRLSWWRAEAVEIKEGKHRMIYKVPIRIIGVQDDAVKTFLKCVVEGAGKPVCSVIILNRDGFIIARTKDSKNHGMHRRRSVR